MAYLKIYCDSCGQSWEVYERAMNDEKSRECPRCRAEIDQQTWKKQILPAWGQVSDSNRELIKDHTGYYAPLFSFDVIDDYGKIRRENNNDYKH